MMMIIIVEYRDTSSVITNISNQ